MWDALFVGCEVEIHLRNHNTVKNGIESESDEHWPMSGRMTSVSPTSSRQMEEIQLTRSELYSSSLL
jgi:hypothetical protein